MKKLLTTTILALAAGTADSGEVEILDVVVQSTNASVYRFDVTLRHADTGWGHYADGWEILSPDGAVLGRRVLYHPHVEEQPFTRSLGDVAIPGGVDHVLIRAHDKVHGYSSQPFRVELAP